MLILSLNHHAGPRTLRRQVALIGARVGALALCAAASGCYEGRPLPAPAAASCAPGCHGGKAGPAPPTGSWLAGSQSETSQRGVGAHRAHLDAPSGLARPLACETCHVVPERVDSPGHLDPPPAEVTLTGLATAESREARWDGARCSSYCHGPGSPADTGGAFREPEWTRVDGSQIGCDGCHGFPPAGAHPREEACATCHPSAGPGRSIADVALHLDGMVQITGGAQGCASCHGSAESAAPPRDTQGNTDPSARGVGVHPSHVRATALHAPYACAACHVEPTTVDAAGHTDTPLPAEVTFGTIARGELLTPPAGLSPTFDASTLRCSSVYCHARDGAGVPTVEWTKPQRLVCGSCHGLPPTKTASGQAHAPAALGDCHNCHRSVVDATGKIIAPERHANGKVDL